MEGLQQLYNPSQCCLMCHGSIAVTAIFIRAGGQTIILHTIDHFSGFWILAAVRSAFHCIIHLFNQVINKKHLKFHTWIVDLNRQVSGNIVAESSYCAVVVWTHPLACQIWETVHIDGDACFFPVVEEKFFPVSFTDPVFACSEPAGQSCLLAAAQHDRSLVVMGPEHVQQCTGKTKVAGFKLCWICRPVHTGQVKDKITI